MKWLRFIRNVCAALVVAVVIVGAVFAFSFVVEIDGWKVLIYFVPVFLIELLLQFMREWNAKDERKEDDDDGDSY